MQKQIKYKNWEVTFSLCHQIGCFGNFAFLFNIGWWYSKDAKENKNFEINFDLLCFTFHIEVWKWVGENETALKTSID